MDVVIHFGQFKGRKLSELAPHQVHWLETVWAPRRENHPEPLPRDRALLVALAANREVRDGHPAAAGGGAAGLEDASRGAADDSLWGDAAA